jgi:biotin-dependent carboxylase-like uncharacterized protein
MTGLTLQSIAPSASIQDRGRQGWLRYGLTGSGAVDQYALAEGQALLGNGPDDAALFVSRGSVAIATSGAEMALAINGAPAAWRRSYHLSDGDQIEIGAAKDGVYGYLHMSGGFRTDLVLGARATHRRASLGHIPAAGETLEAGRATPADVPLGLSRTEYFDRRVIRMMWGAQSRYFSDETRQSFVDAQFTITKMRDRMGVQISPDCGPVHADAGLSIASDTINHGDIQITGDGTPAILLADRGSSGGYPRIGTVITADLDAVAQMPTGAVFRFEVVSRDAAVAALRTYRAGIAALSGQARPVLRDPREMRDLLAYNLIDGMLRGDEHDDN